MAAKKKPRRAAEKKSKSKPTVKRPKARQCKAAKSKLTIRRLSARMTRRIPEIKLDDWSKFEATIRSNLGNRELVVRNFHRIVFDDFKTPGQVEVDLLPEVRKTGTDRRKNAHMWNAAGFDHDHDGHPKGMKPNDIIYAFWVDFRSSPYKASRAQGDNTVKMEAYDLTEALTELDAMIVYDPARLKRASANEYWFLSKPFDAALLLLTSEE
jgi:hypothetical protein